MSVNAYLKLFVVLYFVTESTQLSDKNWENLLKVNNISELSKGKKSIVKSDVEKNIPWKLKEYSRDSDKHGPHDEIQRHVPFNVNKKYLSDIPFTRFVAANFKRQVNEGTQRSTFNKVKNHVHKDDAFKNEIAQAKRIEKLRRNGFHTSHHMTLDVPIRSYVIPDIYRKIYGKFRRRNALYSGTYHLNQNSEFHDHKEGLLHSEKILARSNIIRAKSDIDRSIPLDVYRYLYDKFQHTGH